jgi:uncharacterized Zn-finger protein
MYGHRRHYSESMTGSYPFASSATVGNGAWSKQPTSVFALPSAVNQALPPLPPAPQPYPPHEQPSSYVTAMDLSMQARPNLVPANNVYLQHPLQPPQLVKKQYTHGRSLSDFSHHINRAESSSFIQSHRRAISATSSEYAHNQKMEEDVEEEDSERSGSASPPSQFADSPAGSGRYACPYCQKAFSRPSSLRIHTYSHTGEKPFQCLHPGCDRKFSVQSNMRRHLRVHRLSGK